MIPAFGALLLLVLFSGIVAFIAWVAAKGFPKTWDRTTFVLAFPVFLFVGAGGFYAAQHWNPFDILPFVLKEITGYGSILILAVSGGCMLAIFTYGRLAQKPAGSGPEAQKSHM